ncbi:2306_t:CDS:2, partial [Paraglomus occultum]
MSLLPSYSQYDPLQQSHTSNTNLSCQFVTPPQPVLTVPPPIDPPAYSPPDIIIHDARNQKQEEENDGEYTKSKSYKQFFFCLMAFVNGVTFVISCIIINKFLTEFIVFPAASLKIFLIGFLLDFLHRIWEILLITWRYGNVTLISGLVMFF